MVSTESTRPSSSASVVAERQTGFCGVAVAIVVSIGVEVIRSVSGIEVVRREAIVRGADVVGVVEAITVCVQAGGRHEGIGVLCFDVVRNAIAIGVEVLVVGDAITIKVDASSSGSHNGLLARLTSNHVDTEVVSDPHPAWAPHRP